MWIAKTQSETGAGACSGSGALKLLWLRSRSVTLILKGAHDASPWPRELHAGIVVRVPRTLCSVLRLGARRTPLGCGLALGPGMGTWHAACVRRYRVRATDWAGLTLTGHAPVRALGVSYGRYCRRRQTYACIPISSSRARGGDRGRHAESPTGTGFGGRAGGAVAMARCGDAHRTRLGRRAASVEARGRVAGGVLLEGCEERLMDHGVCRGDGSDGAAGTGGSARTWDSEGLTIVNCWMASGRSVRSASGRRRLRPTDSDSGSGPVGAWKRVLHRRAA